MRAASQRILIVSSNTGGGHQSAAGALQESFLRLSPDQVWVSVVQALEEAHGLTHHFVKLYNYLLRHNQYYMRYYYGAIHRLRPYESHFLFQLCLKYGTQLFERLAPTTLVSVHPMTQHFFAYVLKKLRLLDKIPLITVVTDPYAGFWKGWACDEVSQYFVASDSAKQQLMEYGVADTRIQVTGMPIHSKFQPLDSLLEKYQLRQLLGLQPERFTVLVNAGWIGGGNIPDLFQSLFNMPLDNLQVIFVAGRNEELRRMANRFSREAPFPVVVSGFTQQMERLMNASDVMISKLGGLTTFEAMACHLPVLADCLTPPMPQETGTAKFISEYGAGVLIHEPAQVAFEIQRMMQEPEYYQGFRLATEKLIQPGAVDRITRGILNYAH